MLQEHRKKGSQGLGRSKGGLTTKIHAVSVNETTVVNFLLSPGNCADCPVGKELLESWYHPETKAVLMDKAYGSQENKNICHEKNWLFVVPPRKNAKNYWYYDTHLYTLRNQIERLFNRIKNYRRVATRYDKLAHMYSSFVSFAFILIAIGKC